MGEFVFLQTYLLDADQVYVYRLKRDGSGSFSDADIVKILQDSTSYRAGAFRARGIPDVLRVIEILGIEQARGWGACSVRGAPSLQMLIAHLSFTVERI